MPAASTSPFSVAASQLAISTQPPADVTTGAAFSLTVAAVDPTGDVDPTFNGPVTLALANNPGGATLGGTLTATASNGVATFTNVSISNAGSGYTLQATALGLASSTTNAITVVAAGTATALVLTSAAEQRHGRQPLGLAVPRKVQGNVVSSFNGSVTIANAGGLLNGTLTVTAVNGVATFSGLSIDLAAPYYVLDATAAGLTGAATGYIAVTPAAATHLVVPAPSANILTGAPFTLAVSAEDPYGNVASNFHGNVTLAPRGESRRRHVGRNAHRHGGKRRGHLQRTLDQCSRQRLHPPGNRFRPRRGDRAAPDGYQRPVGGHNGAAQQRRGR